VGNLLTCWAIFKKIEDPISAWKHGVFFRIIFKEKRTGGSFILKAFKKPGIHGSFKDSKNRPPGHVFQLANGMEPPPPPVVGGVSQFWFLMEGIVVVVVVVV
jgi:hypothetical protein